jgi:hypothetical protein
MGACGLASVKYNSFDQEDSDQREVYADMMASNIQILRKKPCLSIDICGGNHVENWTTSVYALVKRPRQFQHNSQNYKWNKSLLYQGDGISAIVRIAAGLLACIPYFPSMLDDFGERLGSCVGLADDGRVFKAFDTTESRNSNIDVIRDLLDENALVWKSDDESSKIVEMRYRQSNWKGDLNAGVFVSILQKLLALHKQDLVHGDIRLDNLLSTGFIVDFDLVGLDTYPEGLNLLFKDGERHPDVATAISNNTIHATRPVKEHDWFSMTKVLELFLPKAEWWQQATDYVRVGRLDQAIVLLEEHKGDAVFLNPAFSP